MHLRRLTEILCCRMKVDLCARDLAMAQQIAEREQIYASLYKVSGKAMPQCMRRNILPDTGLSAVRPDPIIDPVPAHPPPIPALEKAFLFLDHSSLKAIAPQCQDHSIVERNDPFVSSLPGNADCLAIEIDIFFVHAGAFRGSNASAIDKGDQRMISHADNRLLIGRSNQPANLLY